MKVHLKIQCGPLDGQYEFDDSEFSSGKEESLELVNAKGIWFGTNGEIGKGKQTVAPSVWHGTKEGSISKEDAKHSTIHEYWIIHRNEEAGIIDAIAEHRPKFRPKQKN